MKCNHRVSLSRICILQDTQSATSFRTRTRAMVDVLVSTGLYRRSRVPRGVVGLMVSVSQPSLGTPCSTVITNNQDSILFNHKSNFPPLPFPSPNTGGNLCLFGLPSALLCKA